MEESITRTLLISRFSSYGPKHCIRTLLFSIVFLEPFRSWHRPCSSSLGLNLRIFLKTRHDLLGVEPPGLLRNYENKFRSFANRICKRLLMPLQIRLVERTPSCRTLPLPESPNCGCSSMDADIIYRLATLLIRGVAGRQSWNKE
jgi:hypothetical protein